MSDLCALLVGGGGGMCVTISGFFCVSWLGVGVGVMGVAVYGFLLCFMFVYEGGGMMCNVMCVTIYGQVFVDFV